MELDTGLQPTTVYFLPDFLSDVDQYLLDLYRQRRVKLSRSNLVSLALREYIENHPVKEMEPALASSR